MGVSSGNHPFSFSIFPGHVGDRLPNICGLSGDNLGIVWESSTDQLGTMWVGSFLATLLRRKGSKIALGCIEASNWDALGGKTISMMPPSRKRCGHPGQSRNTQSIPERPVVAPHDPLGDRKGPVGTPKGTLGSSFSQELFEPSPPLHPHLHQPFNLIAEKC